MSASIDELVLSYANASSLLELTSNLVSDDSVAVVLRDWDW